jgi:SAM-dependent methyltransferase
LTIMGCPLCGHNQARASWLGSTFYQDKEYPYVECLSCGSLYCEPMPDYETLTRMYGLDYSGTHQDGSSIEDPKQPQKIIEWLRRAEKGTFVDYGCGAGALLEQARRLGWEAVGIELNNEVAREVERRTGARVITRLSDLPDEPVADILHLGDVIEHLTELDRQMPRIIKLLKPGGTLLAQGPLEANACLFNLALRLSRRMRPSRKIEGPPYHVILATAQGQRAFFERFRLKEVRYALHEEAWPAPIRLSLSDLRRARSVGLFILRRLSQATSVLRPERLGNRYFYVGRWSG